jgi:hypothetical protein
MGLGPEPAHALQRRAGHHAEGGSETVGAPIAEASDGPIGAEAANAFVTLDQSRGASRMSPLMMNCTATAARSSPITRVIAMTPMRPRDRTIR